MNKKVVIIVLVLVLSLSFVSAGFWGDLWGKITGRTAGPDSGSMDCIDLDGPNNFLTSSFVKYYSKYYYDYCSGNVVYDYCCSKTSSTPVAFVIKKR